MSTLVQRKIAGKEEEAVSKDESKAAKPPVTADMGSEEEMEPLPSMPSGDDSLPQDTANVEVLNSALKDINPRWRNWIVRGIFTWLMIFMFGFIIFLGIN